MVGAAIVAFFVWMPIPEDETDIKLPCYSGMGIGV
jgi:hypothetical protein